MIGFLAGEAVWPTVVTRALQQVGWRSVWLAAAVAVVFVALPVLWPETFGTRQVGLVRGVYAAFSVTASAVAPFLFGAALTRSIPLASIGLACGLYCLLVPPVLAGYVRRG